MAHEMTPAPPADRDVVAIHYEPAQGKREKLLIDMVARGPGRLEAIADPAVVVAALIARGVNVSAIRVAKAPAAPPE